MYRDINDFKKGYQPRTNVVKDEKGDLVADSHSIVARWRNYFSQLLNVLDTKFQYFLFFVEVNGYPSKSGFWDEN